MLGSPDEQDRVASATTFGFVIDLAAIQIERETGAIRIDKYASVHDVGTQLNPRIVEGQIHGGFVHGLGAALMEELVYDERGNFHSGTFADYLCPTAMEVPSVAIGHVETASPTNAFGAKGMGDGSCMLTPAALANAVADALGREDITLPLTLQSGDGRDFALHPNLPELQALFNQGKLGVVANVGTLVAPVTRAQYLAGGAAVPPQLFSHADQSVQWQTSVPNQISKTGWGGWSRLIRLAPRA